MNQTKKTQRELYDLSEVEQFLRDYNEWYIRQQQPSTADSNPNDPPPPPPGPIKP